MPYSIQRVQPPLKFIPPALDPLTLRLIQGLLPLWMRYQVGITQVQTDHVELLVELYRQFQAGESRFLLAFRHASTDDPLALATLLWQWVPQIARRQRVPLQKPIHSYFIYDRGIPLWAGNWVAGLYSRLGGTPILRGRMDRLGLRSARDLFANGDHPIAAAPEGATNGHSGIVSPLEPGIAQMGFWCVEDLRKAGRSEAVLIVPIGIQYHYIDASWEQLEALLTQLEKETGLMTEAVLPTVNLGRIQSPTVTKLYQRLNRLGEHLLTLMEQYYTEFYHQAYTTSTIEFSPIEIPISTNQILSVRLQQLLDIALRVAEQYFELQPKGSYIDRCRRLEQAGWDRIYREDLKPDQLSPVERGLADRIAEESSLRMWHMRLVESFVAVTGKYVQEQPTIERFAETLLLLSDTIVKIKGGNPFHRPNLGRRAVRITVSPPISVSDRWETYQVSRREAKQAIADLTQDLQTALEKMIP